MWKSWKNFSMCRFNTWDTMCNDGASAGICLLIGSHASRRGSWKIFIVCVPVLCNNVMCFMLIPFLRKKVCYLQVKNFCCFSHRDALLTLFPWNMNLCHLFTCLFIPAKYGVCCFWKAEPDLNLEHGHIWFGEGRGQDLHNFGFCTVKNLLGKFKH